MKKISDMENTDRRNVTISSVLPDKLISHLADNFTNQGGFTERLFQIRSAERSNSAGKGRKN